MSKREKRKKIKPSENSRWAKDSPTDFLTLLRVRTGGNGAKFRTEFLDLLKKTSEQEMVLKIVEELRILKMILPNWEKIDEIKYAELRNWGFELRTTLSRRKHAGKSEWWDKNIAKFICRNCGADLSEDTVRKKHIWYCSDSCRKEGPRQRKGKWRKKNPDAHFKSQKKYYSSL